jgi:alcohol dehydrogenase class IV
VRGTRLQHATPAFRTFAGEGCLESLPKELDRLHATRAIVVCGASMSRERTSLARVVDVLGARAAGVFDEVKEHSPIAVVEAATEHMESVGADAIIALGGGSAVVTARAASILRAEKGDVRELCTRRGADGRLVSPRLSAPKAPIWVVPSTPTTAYAKAGSAVRDTGSGERLALFDPKTRAQGVFLDPQVAMTAPPELVRASALNAFSMSVEGLQSPAYDPLAEALLAQGLRELTLGLDRMSAGADDSANRIRLMLGALLSGQGSDFVGGGLAQALSHAAGPRSTTSNGVVEALLLPHTLRFNEPVARDGQQKIARALSVLVGGGSSAAPIEAVERVLELAEVPRRLRDVGVGEGDLDEIMAHALDDWSVTRVPRPVTATDLSALLRAAW